MKTYKVTVTWTAALPPELIAVAERAGKTPEQAVRALTRGALDLGLGYEMAMAVDLTVTATDAPTIGFRAFAGLRPEEQN